MESPIRSDGVGSTARMAVSAMTRAEASCSLLRRTTWLITTARAETVITVESSMDGTTAPRVPLDVRSARIERIAATPIRTVLASEKNGAAINGAATNIGTAVKGGGLR